MYIVVMIYIDSLYQQFIERFLMTNKEKNKERTRENRIRRIAKRQGYVLQKSNSRNKQDNEYGMGRLCDMITGTIVFGDLGGFGKSLDEIEKFLNKEFA